MMILIFLTPDNLPAIDDTEHSESTQSTKGALRRNSAWSTQRAREHLDFIIPSEPKILHLVVY